MSELAALLAGHGALVELPGGRRLPYANLDHAASTPPFTAVLDAVTRFAPRYANVHRGRGWASRVSTDAFEAARESLRRFIGAGDDQLLVFTRNTTESLNHLAAQLPVAAGSVVVSTLMEHHSNDLPWRRVAPVLRAGVDVSGRVDEQQLLDLLLAHRGRVAALAVSAASNVTGLLNPVHRWAQWAHAAGAPIVVDAAQLVPHRPLDLRASGDPEHLDYVAFSAHKMYAPFGVGVLAGPRGMFDARQPWQTGGGTVETVADDEVHWTVGAERQEAGTPCVLGAIALAESVRQLSAIGWDRIRANETRLAQSLRSRLGAIDGVTLYGRDGGDGQLGVIAFNVEGLPHALAAAILADEHGIGTRSGCFCAQPYAKALLGISTEEARVLAKRIVAGDRSNVPGMVRASLGLATTDEHVSRLVAAVAALSKGDHDGHYQLDPACGEYAWT